MPRLATWEVFVAWWLRHMTGMLRCLFGGVLPLITATGVMQGAVSTNNTMLRQARAVE